MIIAAMQPYTFPYIGYFQLLHSVNTIVFLDDVNFITKGWINRNYIEIGGEAHLFTIPLNKASRNKRINEIKIVDGWQDKFRKKLEHAYGKSPNFGQGFELVTECLAIEESLISDFAIKTTCLLGREIGIPLNEDYDLSSNLNINTTGQQRIIDICKIKQASEYHNPIGGMELYSQESFEGITLKFIKSGKIPDKSIIHVLMTCPLDEIRDMVHDYSLQ